MKDDRYNPPDEVMAVAAQKVHDAYRLMVEARDMLRDGFLRGAITNSLSDMDTPLSDATEEMEERGLTLERPCEHDW